MIDARKAQANYNKKRIHTMWKDLQPCIDLVSLYTCPEDCDICCRKDRITFEQYEIEKIYKAHIELRNMIKPKIVLDKNIYSKYGFNLYYFNEFPCPLLKDKKCLIHDVSPFVCKAYPFTLGKEPSPEYIALDPCQLGIQIMRDITIFNIESYVSDEELSKDERDKKIEDSINDLIKLEKYAENFGQQKKVSLMYVPLSAISSYYKLKKATPTEEMDTRRKTIKEWVDEGLKKLEEYEKLNKN